MIKKIIFIIFLFFVINLTPINASVGSLVKVGNNYYETIEEAIANANSNDTVTLISDVKLNDTLQINKTVNLNLNGNNILASQKVFQVQGGILNITGKGTIKETEPNYGAIMVIGSTNSNDTNYSVVNVGKDVTLEGWSGIFITHNSSKSYGVEVNFAGTINAINDTSGGTGAGIYVNGNIKDKNNSPTVNIQDGAEIKSTGNGLYIAGYTILNINEANISGTESGIGIKSGILNIDGATISSDGEDKTPTEGYNNGIKASGTAIQIESNSGYAGNIELNIDNGTFKSKNSNVLYEYIGVGTNSQVIAIDISGGSFINNNSKDVILLSDSLKQYHSSFISGGKYSSNPNEYLKPGYSYTLENDMYIVTQSTMKEIDSNNINKNSSTIIYLIIFTIILILTIYLSKRKKLN